MKLYIAGPMTGIPAFNFPAFLAEAEAIRAIETHEEIGLIEVVCPAELDNPEDRERAMASLDGGVIHYESGKTWGDFLARDIKLLTDGGFDAVVVLPNWHTSRGARLETFVAYLNGVQVVYRDGDSFYAVPFEQLAQAWTAPGGWEYLNGFFANYFASQFSSVEPFTVIDGGKA